MYVGRCSLNLTAICVGAQRRMCLTCPMYTASAVPDIEDIAHRPRVFTQQRRGYCSAAKPSDEPASEGLVAIRSRKPSPETTALVTAKAALVASISTPPPAPAPLPPSLTPFTSPEGRKMFAESLQEGFAENYFPLAEQIDTQRVPSANGAGTLAMVLNALQVDPLESGLTTSPVWKGVWRWFSEDMVVKGRCKKKQGAEAMSFREFACLARRGLANLAQCSVFPTDSVSEATFRIHVKTAAVSPHAFVVPCYDKAVLGTGPAGATYSPIAAYHADSDSVLVMDVDRTKTLPHWVPLRRLWEAMQHKGGTSTGYMLFQRQPEDEVEDKEAPSEVQGCRHCASPEKKAPFQCSTSLLLGLTRLCRGTLAGVRSSYPLHQLFDECQAELQSDSQLMETLSASATHEHVSLSVAEGGLELEPTEVLALTTFILASPADIVTQVLPEEHQAALWWMRKVDKESLPYLDEYIQNWNTRLQWMYSTTRRPVSPPRPTMMAVAA
eukprot:Sspe_Gene.84148::Locus_55235_Transcript_2_2_Confidence_0.667_Length_1749::g.84148::m.84148/K05941/E2.3.2.15; glutathione gamma-glutamylcysteinyltransferase